MIRLIFAHIVDFIHANILHHRPFRSCYHVMKLWPEGDCGCKFCKWAWSENCIR